MKKFLLVIVGLIIFTLTLSTIYAFQTDVSGDWELTLKTPRGERTSSLHIDQDGEKITVTMITSRGEVSGEGTVKGNEIEWTITRSTPRGELAMTYRGAVEGETMQGTMETRMGRSLEWTAKRKN
jgi:hypothetical protein